MSAAVQTFMDYAKAFEETYADDDWSRLERFFHEQAVYEVVGGSTPCRLEGRDAVLAGLKKSVDGMDRRCDERKIKLTEGPEVKPTAGGEEVHLGWCVVYRRGDAPPVSMPGRSVATVVDGVITELRDLFDDAEIAGLRDWMAHYGADLDGSYV